MNLEVPLLSWFFKGPIRWWSNINSLANEENDKHTHKIAGLMMMDSEQRDRLTQGIFYPKTSEEALGRLEETFKVVKRAEAAEDKIRHAIKKGVLPKQKLHTLIEMAAEKSVITAEEKRDLVRSEELRYDAIQVDDFSQEEYLGHKVTSPSPARSDRDSKQSVRVI